ncbi:hypothetical protein HDF24_04155 [Mucilaginibacter sp. X4EP1]|uniref:hypothetical protein n=1 Tax=Mucilaginibacter sp. X4EP1 TaxID=2723092 RepID=UPI0021688A28|nr:hypothetical protein [Mucilaginibacter sp. X4EP1]MCS3816643.1 hypothetical protein [Mucilaginibacter sp. X4EP1]
MDKKDNKDQACAPVHKPEQTPPPKQSSGDKSFDDAIDRMLKKPVYTAPTK